MGPGVGPLIPPGASSTSTDELLSNLMQRDPTTINDDIVREVDDILNDN